MLDIQDCRLHADLDAVGHKRQRRRRDVWGRRVLQRPRFGEVHVMDKTKSKFSPKYQDGDFKTGRKVEKIWRKVMKGRTVKEERKAKEGKKEGEVIEGR